MRIDKEKVKMCQNILTNREGIALVIVIWILALLTTIAAELAFSMKTEVNIVRNFKEATQAHYIAQAGLNQAIMALLRRNTPIPSDLGSNSGLSQPLRVNAPNPPQPFDDGYFEIQLENSSGRIDLNSASPNLLGILVSGLGIDDKEKAIIIDSILDWRDSDDFHRLNGAEDDYYNALEVPYPCKNDIFFAIEELQLVRGISPEIYKLLVPMIVVIPSHTFAFYDDAFDEGDGSDDDGPLTTKININAAHPNLLAGLPQLSLAHLEQILQYRLNNDFHSLQDVQTLLGANTLAAIAPYITTALSPYFIIRVDGRMASSPARQTIEALVRFGPGMAKNYEIMRMDESLF